MIRAIRSYRSVSAEAACALAGTPSWDLEAKLVTEIYRRAVEFRAENGFRPPPEEVRVEREAVRRSTMVRWSSRLEAPRAVFAAEKRILLKNKVLIHH